MSNSNATRYRVPAKVNLFLEVLHPRDDGYHEVQTVMQTVSLFDELEFSVTDGGIEIRGFDGSVVPDDANLVAIVARRLQEFAGRRRGCVVRATKRIPVAAGLGGGSADAAVALVALNRLWNCSLTDSDLFRLAAEIGSDVTFFLVGGTALCRGRGEKVEPLPCAGSLHLVLVSPAVSLSARDVYRSVDFKQPLETRDAHDMMDALLEHDPGRIARLMFNRLELGAVRLAGGLDVIRRRLLDAGALGAMVSGSGSSVFGVVEDVRAARRVAARVESERLGKVSIVKTNVRESWMYGKERKIA